jgi:hypothetical protein
MDAQRSPYGSMDHPSPTPPPRSPPLAATAAAAALRRSRALLPLEQCPTPARMELDAGESNLGGGGAGEREHDGTKQDAGVVISSIVHGNKRIGERETRKRHCASLASDVARLLEGQIC